MYINIDRSIKYKLKNECVLHTVSYRVLIGEGRKAQAVRITLHIRKRAFSKRYRLTLLMLLLPDNWYKMQKTATEIWPEICWMRQEYGHCKVSLWLWGFFSSLKVPRDLNKEGVSLLHIFFLQIDLWQLHKVHVKLHTFPNHQWKWLLNLAKEACTGLSGP